MMKCKEHLAFVSCNTGKVKERFELQFNEKDLLIEGRRKQLAKKLITYFLNKNILTGQELFSYLKKTHAITGRDLLRYAYGKGEN